MDKAVSLALEVVGTSGRLGTKFTIVEGGGGCTIVDGGRGCAMLTGGGWRP